LPSSAVADPKIMVKTISTDKIVNVMRLAFMVFLFLLKELVRFVELDWIDFVNFFLQHGLGGPMHALGWLDCPVLAIS